MSGSIWIQGLAWASAIVADGIVLILIAACGVRKGFER